MKNKISTYLIEEFEFLSLPLQSIYKLFPHHSEFLLIAPYFELVFNHYQVALLIDVFEGVQYILPHLIPTF